MYVAVVVMQLGRRAVSGKCIEVSVAKQLLKERPISRYA